MEIYTDLNSVPVDPTPATDAIDKPDNEKPLTDPAALAATPAKQTVYVIPFSRVIKLGSRGTDVRGAKRAIWRANKLKLTAFTPIFGPIAVSQLKKFQKAHGLKADGQLGPATLKKLAPHFDAYAFLLYVGYAPGNKEAGQRKKIVAYATWGYNHRSLIHYAETRPMDRLNDLEHLPITNDCSEFATKAYKYAGVSDPNGFGYNGAGWTGTLAVHGKSVSLAQAQVGDLVLYGPRPSYSHVAIYVGNGRVISHGSEIGPLLLPIDYRSDRGDIRSYL